MAQKHSIARLILKLVEALREREREDEEGTPPHMQVPDEVFYLLIDLYSPEVSANFNRNLHGLL